jgi:hypothetical protein
MAPTNNPRVVSENATFVLAPDRTPLMPCRAVRARELLSLGRASVFHTTPFVIVLHEAAAGTTMPIELRIDPGSRVGGLALVADYPGGSSVVWAAEIEHRGLSVHEKMEARAAQRRGRRHRKTRYRPPRFNNRKRSPGWLAPSIETRLCNVVTWARRLCTWCPVTSIAVEDCLFDTQRMENPDISGVEYQQGRLWKARLREYVLAKYGRKCAYCGRSGPGVRLELDRVIPGAQGGTYIVSNCVIACRECNQKKGARTAAEFGHPDIHVDPKFLRDAAAVNTTRHIIVERLAALGLPITKGDAGLTKYNRTEQGYRKAHWIDAACVGDRGGNVWLNPQRSFLRITSKGHGSRQMVQNDGEGFPRRTAAGTPYAPKGKGLVHGFKTGDIVRTDDGRVGRVTVRHRGRPFMVGGRDVSRAMCQAVQFGDGYDYATVRG